MTEKGPQLGRPFAVEFVIQQTPLPVAPGFAIVITRVADPHHRLRPFSVFLMDSATGEVRDVVCFATLAAALHHHAKLCRDNGANGGA